MPDVDKGYKPDDTKEPSGHEPPALRSISTQSKAANQLAFSAAGHQLHTLALFGADALVPVSIEAEMRARAERREALLNAFVLHGSAEFDSNGYSEILKFFAASDAIHAKALLLGYGPGSASIEITSVPGGFVGQFGGNDIYAAAR